MKVHRCILNYVVFIDTGVEVNDPCGFIFDSNLAAQLPPPLAPLSTSAESQSAGADSSSCPPLINESDECDETDLIGSRDVLSHVDDHDLGVLDSIANSNLKDFTTLLSLRNKYSGSSRQFNIETSQFVRITTDIGVEKIVRKSSLVWFLQNGARKLSNDRTVRVTQMSLLYRNNPPDQEIGRRALRIGDWAIFQKENSCEFLLGRVLSFGMLQGSRKELSKFIDRCDIGDSKIGALCSWYHIELEPTSNLFGAISDATMLNHGLHPCAYYVLSTPSPSIIYSNWFGFSSEIVLHVNQLLSTHTTVQFTCPSQ